SDFFSNNCGTSYIILQIRSHLNFHMLNTFHFGLPAKPSHFLIRISQPPCCGGVGWVPMCLHLLHTASLTRFFRFQNFCSLLWCYHISDISKVNTTNKFLWAHISEKPPKWFTFHLGIKVPNCIDNRPSSQMNHPFFRA